MYIFPEDMRKCYESSPLSFAYYQNIDDKAVPVLVSDGFVRNAGMENESREHVLEWLLTGLYERMHSDDVGYMKKISDDFLHHRGLYDATFRCKIKGEYLWIHGIGKWQTMPDGTELAVIAYSNLTHAREDMGEALNFYDISRRDLFYTDSITGLPNVNYLREYGPRRLELLFAGGKAASVVYSDVYSMLSYNNQYGLSEGDELLRLVAAKLREQFPEDLLVRGANDHFILIASLTGEEELTGRLERANEAIRRNARGNTLGIRSGICALEEGVDLTEGMDRARKALRAIDNDVNRSCFFFRQELDDQYWKNRYIVENFSRAMEAGWIKVFYQGIFRTETKKIAAFEALARWVDPVRGTISPRDFIPVLQKYHLLYRLDLYMMEQVFREVSVRYDNQLPIIPVSVNFSRQDFDHADVEKEIEALYVKHSIEKYAPRSCFIVEVTEQDIAVGTESFRRQLDAIRDKGYGLWLDDFGSGYSAINVLSHYDFDLIKFDMELLRHLDDHGGVNRLILKELIFLAREMKVQTLVEGVETQDQLQFARRAGTELSQGFLFYRPEPLDEILYRLRSGQRMRDCEDEEDRKRFRQRDGSEDRK